MASCTEGLFQVVAALDLGPGDDVVLPSISFLGAAHAVRATGARVVLCDVDPHDAEPDGRARRQRADPGDQSRTRPSLRRRSRGRGGDRGARAGALIQVDRGRRDRPWLGRRRTRLRHARRRRRLVVRLDEGPDERRRRHGLVPRPGARRSDHERGPARRHRFGLRLRRTAAGGRSTRRARTAGDDERPRGGVRRRPARTAPGIPGSTGRDRRGLRRGFAACRGSICHRRAARAARTFYRLQTDHRDRLAQHLLDRGMYTSFRYWPLHRTSMYGDPGPFPGADHAAARTLQLPLHQGLSDADVNAVIDAVRQYRT